MHMPLLGVGVADKNAQLFVALVAVKIIKE